MRIETLLLICVTFMASAHAENTLVIWPPKSKAGAVNLDAISGNGNYLFQIGRREGKAGVEIHKNQAYVFVAQAGEATIEYGGEVENLSERQKGIDNGEFRGDGLKGAKSVKVVAGEVVLIPAGLPYQFT